MPALTCPAPNSRPPALRYIARSTRIGVSGIGHDARRDLGRTQRRMLCRDVQRRPRLRRQPVGDRHRGESAAEQVLHRDRRLDGVRVLQQVEQLEPVDGRALGEVPRGGGRGHRGLGVAAVGRRVPGHRPIDDHRLIGLDDRGELLVGQAGDRRHVERASRKRRERHEATDDRVLPRDVGHAAGALAEEANQDDGRGLAGIEQGEARVERPDGGALGQVARVAPERVRALLVLLQVRERRRRRGRPWHRSGAGRDRTVSPRRLATGRCRCRSFRRRWTTGTGTHRSVPG